MTIADLTDRTRSGWEGRMAGAGRCLQTVGLPLIVAAVVLLVFIPMAFLVSVQLHRHEAQLYEVEATRVGTIASGMRALYVATAAADVRRLRAILAEGGLTVGPGCEAGLARELAASGHHTSLFFQDPDGHVTCAATLDDGHIRPGLVQPRLPTPAPSELHTSRLLIDQATNLPLQQHILARRMRDGSVAGYLSSSFRLDWLAQQFIESGLLENATVSIFAQDTEAVYSAPDQNGWTPRLREMIPGIGETRTTPVIVRAPDRTEVNRIYSVLPLDGENGVFLSIGIPESAALSTARAASLRIVPALVGVGALALLAAFYTGHAGLVRPIRRLHEGMAALRRQQYGTVVPVGGPPEIAELGRDINDLSRRLLDHTEKLNARNLQLQLANQELSAFTYAASHDLRSPVNSVAMVLSDLIGSDAVSDPTSRRMLVGAAAAVSRMQDLISDVLTYADVVNEHQSPRPMTPVVLRTVLDDVCTDLSFDIGRLGADIVIGPLPVVTGNETLLRVLFQNLISNALKFTVHGVAPVVRVSADTTSDPDWITVQVADRGIGIPDKYKDRIFKVFQRLQTHDEYEGTGIGLSLCLRIAVQHGGRISVRSNEGAGSTFILHVPRSLLVATGPGP